LGKLDELYRLGGTSGGARPKIMTSIGNEEWIIKFPAHVDEKMREKWSMIILDYHSLMKLTKILTKDHYADMESMFRRMCFNVFAHNRDDHSKNFTYLYDEEKDQWRLSPAYDLTYSNTYYGEHTTTVDGNGKDPGRKELLAVGITAGMKKNRCMEIIDENEKCVGEMLGDYL